MEILSKCLFFENLGFFSLYLNSLTKSAAYAYSIRPITFPSKIILTNLEPRF